LLIRRKDIFPHGGNVYVEDRKEKGGSPLRRFEGKEGIAFLEKVGGQKEKNTI